MNKLVDFLVRAIVVIFLLLTILIPTAIINYLI